MTKKIRKEVEGHGSDIFDDEGNWIGSEIEHQIPIWVYERITEHALDRAIEVIAKWYWDNNPDRPRQSEITTVLKQLKT